MKRGERSKRESKLLDLVADKGDRNERETKNILARVYGKSNVDRVHRNGNNDPFGLADVMAIRKGWPLRIVQVKTNEFGTEARQKYEMALRNFPSEYARFEVWVRIDYEGWRILNYDFEAEEYVEFLRVESCDTEEVVKQFREAVDYWERFSQG